MEFPHTVYGGRGFRSCLDEVLRVWDEERASGQSTNATGIGNAAVAVVDYATFKRKLRKYSRRRTKLRRLVDKSESTPASRGSSRLIAEDVADILNDSECYGDSEEARQNHNRKLSQAMSTSSSQHQPQHANANANANTNTNADGFLSDGCYVSMNNDGGDDDEHGPNANSNADDNAGCHGLPGIWNNNNIHHHHGPVIGWKRTKVWNFRSVVREVSNLEREGVAGFLADETFAISGMYRSRIRTLGTACEEWRSILWREQELDRAQRQRELQSQPSSTTLPMYTINENSNDNNNNNRNHNPNNNNDNHNNNDNTDDSSSSVTKGMIEQTLVLGKALLDLEAFCALNILVVRQTLIRYDAFARSFGGTPFMEFYLKTVLRSTTPHKNNSNSTSTITSNSDDIAGNSIHKRNIHKRSATTSSKAATPNLYHHELRQILLHKEVTALCDEFARNLFALGLDDGHDDDVHDRDDECNNNNRSRSRSTTSWTGMGTVLQTIADRFQNDREELQRLVTISTPFDAMAAAPMPMSMSMSKLQPNPPTHTSTTTTNTSMTRKLMDVVGKYFLFGMYMEDQFGWYLDGTMNRGKSLTEEMGFLVEWKRQSQKRWSLSGGEILQFWDVTNPGTGFLYRSNNCNSNNNNADLIHAFLEGLECDNLAGCGSNLEGNVDNNNDKDEMFATENGDGDDVEDADVVTQQQKFNLFMALTGGFLYCMNYYIVEPSSTMYVNALGANDAAGATLIGMMPIASFFSAIVYSVWTNTVFRRPFLVSCSLMVLGNVVYSSAFNYKSLPMALIGRFLTGLGGPKMIVRRYMADTTSVGIRTSVNTLFGMVVAAGSALGPGCAIVLSNFEFIVTIPFSGGSELWFNSMTGPGWFMATLWGFFSVALWWGFREQDRIGLAEKLEQDRRERNETLQLRRDVHSHYYSQQGQGHAVDKSNTIHGGNKVTFTMQASPMLPPSNHRLKQTMSVGDDSMRSILTAKSSMSMMSECYSQDETTLSDGDNTADADAAADGTVSKPQSPTSLWVELQMVSEHFHFPVKICMGLLFAKVFVIETLVSCTSVLSKNRYRWTIHQVGLLGCANGFFVIPLSILVGKLSLQHQDRYLMVWLLAVGMAGLCLLIDASDLIDTSESPRTYNTNAAWWASVGPVRYVMGYFVTYLSIQSFEGIIGSALSKLIPTALAKGTFNSGLLATLVDTFGRSCGDLFISLMGFWNIRQLMNLLFVPGVFVLATCLLVIRRYYDLLAV